MQRDPVLSDRDPDTVKIHATPHELPSLCVSVTLGPARRMPFGSGLRGQVAARPLHSH